MKREQAKTFSTLNKMHDAFLFVCTPSLEELDLPMMSYFILLYLAANPEKNTARDVVERWALKPNLVSMHVNRLVERGLVVRGSDPKDRRIIRLQLTDEALPYAERGLSMVDDFMQDVFHDFSQDEKMQFLHLLGRLDNNVLRLVKNKEAKE